MNCELAEYFVVYIKSSQPGIVRLYTVLVLIYWTEEIIHTRDVQSGLQFPSRCPVCPAVDTQDRLVPLTRTTSIQTKERRREFCLLHISL